MKVSLNAVLISGADLYFFKLEMTSEKMHAHQRNPFIVFNNKTQMR